jgi:hypothetical protein
MRTAVDYAKRAEECRRLAKLAPRPEDWGHFLEMLLKDQQESLRQLADRFRSVLFPLGLRRLPTLALSRHER